MLAAWQWVNTVHALAWAMRVTYVFLGFAVWFNLREALEPAVDKPWRKMYAYKGIVSLMAFVWYTALLLGLVGPLDALFALRWLQPLIVSGLFTSALLHRWEVANLREKKRQEDRLRAMLEDREKDK
jgi:hypothetical protein